MQAEPITITPAIVEDAEGIQDVLYRTWLATYPNAKLGITEEDIHDRYKDTMSEERLERRRTQIREVPVTECFLVAKDGAKVVGVCRVIRHEDHNQLQAIYVLPEYQGKGVGYRLWAEAEKSLDSRKETLVEVVDYNKPAIAFYEKLGFVDTGKRFQDESFRMKSGAIFTEAVCDADRWHEGLPRPEDALALSISA